LGRITVPPNVFVRDIAHPSVNLESCPSSREEPSGAPPSPTGAEPMDEDPRTKRTCSPCSRGTGPMRPRPWMSNQPQRGGLARQLHRLDGSRGTPLGPI
jgi:hypothetical protein